ncbi:MAG: CopG family ribbon-helix-helix protein [Caulobacteraceae bacterium]
MAKTLPVSVRLEAELNDKLAAIARALDRPKSWAIVQAVEEYVAIQQWQFAAIEEGLAAAERGDVVPHEEVTRWVDSWGRPDELPMPRSPARPAGPSAAPEKIHQKKADTSSTSSRSRKRA